MDVRGNVNLHNRFSLFFFIKYPKGRFENIRNFHHSKTRLDLE